MKKLFYLAFAFVALGLSAVSLKAQGGVSTGLYLDQSSFAPIQSDAITGVNIDPIAKDRSNRACARIKIALDRMSPEEISGVQVKTIGGNILVMKKSVATGGNGIIVEMTARPDVRFLLTHDKIGSSNVVTVNLEGDKEYSMKGWSNAKKAIAISTDDPNDPRIGAQVYLDGEFKGTIGHEGFLNIMDVYLGEHRVRIEDAMGSGEEVINVSNSDVFFKVNVRSKVKQFVVFNITPLDANATLLFNNLPLGVVNGVASQEVVSGRYPYTITSDRYHTKTGYVDVTADNVAEVNVELLPKYGYLNVTETSAARGAFVYVDNRQIGNVPCRVEMPSGSHNIRIVQQMYDPYTTTITIEDGKTFDLYPALDAKFSEIVFAVDNSAEIYLDGKLIGNGTATRKVEFGGHRIECRKEGHTPSVRNLNVTSAMNGQTIRLDAPTPIYGSLSVQSSPLGAEIYVDGVMMGKTPKVLNNIIVGTRDVEVRLNGYIPWKKTVSIKKDAPQYITPSELTLRKEDRDVTVNLATESNARIYVDGVYVGMGKWTGIIKEGQHKFEARKTDHRDGVLDYYLRYNDGRPVTLNIPNPIQKTGSLNITSTAGASIYVSKDGSESRYIAPYSNRSMPVGKYSAYASASGYHSSPTKYFNVYENETTNVELDMKKIGWLEYDTDYDTYSNLEFTYGMGINTSDYRTGSENYLGLNWSYAPKAMGLHTSLMFGLDAGDIGFTAGPVLHLTDYTSTDWQLYAGIGARHDPESRAYDPLFSSYAWHWLVDAGIRMNFDELSSDSFDAGLSFASLSLGCKFSSDMFIPTVGLSLFPAFAYHLADNSNYDFAAHFCGVSMGYDTYWEEFMIGVYYSYCRTQVGMYTNLMFGEDGGYSAAVGPVLRLTDDYSFCDWQLYGGIGVQSDEFMGDFGMRFGWQSDSSFSWWDFSVGCQVAEGCFTPTWTLGLGISLTAVLTACTVALAAMEAETESYY